MTRQPFRNSLDYIRAATYFDALSPASKNAVVEIILDDEFMGATDPQALGFMYGLLANNRYSSVLQLGTWMGFSTIVLADALTRSAVAAPRELIFDTVEVNAHAHAKARTFVDLAALGRTVRFVDGSSLDPAVLKKLRPEYDLIYVDSSHATHETRSEIQAYFPKLKRGGIIAFHDSSHYAARWDPTQAGGVRKAIDDWVRSPDGPKECIFFDEPFWGSECGLFIARKT